MSAILKIRSDFLNLRQIAKPFFTLKKGLLFLSIVLITAFGFWLRAYAAPRLSVEVDERVYFQAALKYASFIRQGQWKMLTWNQYNCEHPPLYKVIYGLAILTQPPLENYNPEEFIDGMAMYKIKVSRWGIADRFVSVVFGVLTVLALAVVNPLAGLFFAVDTLAVQFNSMIYLEALPTLTSLLSVLAYLHWCKQGEQKNRSRRSDFLWLGLSAFFLGLSAASKYTYAVVGIALLIHFLVGILSKKIRPTDGLLLAAWGAAALFVFFAFDPYLWKHPIANLLHSLSFHMSYTTNSRNITDASFPFYQPLA